MTQARLPVRIVAATSDGDLEQLLAVRNAVDQRPISIATLRARMADEIRHLSVLAYADDEVVGAGAIGWTAMSAESNDAAYRVWVQPDWLGRGVGGQLFEHLRAFALGNGMTRGFARVEATDERALAFAKRRGFEVFGRNQYGVYALDAATAGPGELPDGVTIVAVHERADLARALYELELQTAPEVPSLAGMPMPPFETWREHLDQPTYLAELSLLALYEGRVVGSIQCDDDGDGTVWISMLSVAPEMRRRGIARALKIELARRAQATGWRTLLTLNDESNEKVRRLNEELGYHYLPEVLLLEATLG